MSFPREKICMFFEKSQNTRWTTAAATGPSANFENIYSGNFYSWSARGIRFSAYKNIYFLKKGQILLREQFFPNFAGKC